LPRRYGVNAGFVTFTLDLIIETATMRRRGILVGPNGRVDRRTEQMFHFVDEARHQSLILQWQGA